MTHHWHPHPDHATDRVLTDARGAIIASLVQSGNQWLVSVRIGYIWIHETAENEDEAKQLAEMMMKERR